MRRRTQLGKSAFLLEKAFCELECQRYKAAIKTANRVLEQGLTESLENRAPVP